MTQSGVIRSAVPYLAAAAASWYIYKIIIKPFLSPLRKIPGRPYKPIIGNMFEALKEEAMTNSINWMKEYKSLIVRFYFLYGEERILVADPEMVKHILVTNSKNYLRFPSNLNSIVPDFLLTLNGEEHHALRKLLNPVFNTHTVNEFIPVFEETSRKVVQCWMREVENNEGQETQVLAQNYMTRLTLDAICRCGFDYDMNSVNDPNSSAVQSFQRILQGLQIRLSQMLPLQWLPTKKNCQAWADMKYFRSIINNVISKKKQKLKQGDESKDLLSRLIHARDENGKQMSDSSLFAQVGGFLFAGFETTSTSLTWTLLLLAENPIVQAKARQEVMAVMPDKSMPITARMVDDMTYLSCVIKESLRLFPPVPVVFRKSVSSDYLGGYFIPAKTPVGISIGALHRLPENWEDPTTFKPERFLKPYDHYKFLPFIAGPYMCIGHIFSLTESKIVLAMLLRNFQVTLPEGYKYRRIRQITMQPKPPLSLMVKPI